MSTLDKIQFNNLLAQMAEQGASDLLLSVGSPPMFRIADSLAPASQEILTAVKVDELIFPILSSDQKEFLTKEKALVFGYTFENGLRFKINLFYQKGCLAASLRFIPQSLRAIKQLGLPKQVEDLANLDSGLILLTGPFNSGKSSTMVAVVEHLNLNKQLRIVTLEKPIEYIFSNKKSIIQQREVGNDTPSFVDGLEDCLDASLDVVVVSQVEIKEEVEKILELAQQGYLVIAVISANTALESILRLVSFFEENEKGNILNILSRVLEAIVCQKLVVSKEGAMMAVVEVLIGTDPMQRIIRDNRLEQINNLIRTSGQDGMISFEQSLAELVEQGVVAPEEAIKHVEDVEGFRHMIE